MSKIFEDNSLTIGHTPLVRLKRVSNGNVLAKVEARQSKLQREVSNWRQYDSGMRKIKAC